MADGDEREGSELSREQKKEIAKWFLTHAPIGEIQYVAKDVRSVLMDDPAYEAAAAMAFPIYNKAHLVSFEMPDRSGDVIISQFGEIGDDSYLDPRTAQVAIVDHVKQAFPSPSLPDEFQTRCQLCLRRSNGSQEDIGESSIICTKVRPATDEELPSSYIEEFWSTLDAELCKYVGESYSKGTCVVYCTSGKDAEGPGTDFEFTVVISAARQSPQNFCNGSWRSIWIVEFKDDLQVVEIKGNIQSPEDSAIAITNIIRHHETEYMVSLEASYLNLPDTTFKDLRRKLPVTRTLFPWHNTLQFSLTREISKELGIGK